MIIDTSIIIKACSIYLYSFKNNLNDSIINVYCVRPNGGMLWEMEISRNKMSSCKTGAWKFGKLKIKNRKQSPYILQCYNQ